MRHAAMQTAYNKAVTPLQRSADSPENAEKYVEATPGIEPGYADLQSAASPLRHVALLENRALAHDPAKWEPVRR